MQLAVVEDELEQARGVREEAEAAQLALAEAHSEIERLTARLASTRGELEAAMTARAQDAEERRELKAALAAAGAGHAASPTAESSSGCCAPVSAKPMPDS